MGAGLKCRALLRDLSLSVKSALSKTSNIWLSSRTATELNLGLADRYLSSRAPVSLVFYAEQYSSVPGPGASALRSFIW